MLLQVLVLLQILVLLGDAPGHLAQVLRCCGMQGAECRNAQRGDVRDRMGTGAGW